MTDVLVVSLGSTGGWRASDATFAAAIERAGASAVVATAKPQGDVRTYALTDLRWARAARAAAKRAITEHEPRAIVYSATTRWRVTAAPGATASGSARSSAGGWRRRRCSCR